MSLPAQNALSPAPVKIAIQASSLSRKSHHTSESLTYVARSHAL